MRFAAADEVALSPAFGRETCYVAVQVYRGMRYEPTFRAVEEILSGYDGRPHWGKVRLREADAPAGGGGARA